MGLPWFWSWIQQWLKMHSVQIRMVVFVGDLAYCFIQTKNLFSGEWLVILCRCKLCKEWLFIKVSLAYLQLSWSDGKVSGLNSRIISHDWCDPQIDSMWESKNNNNNNKRALLVFFSWLHRITVPSSNFWTHWRKPTTSTGGRIY